MPGLAVLKVLGAIIVIAGAWSAIVPYVGPTFGYPMPPGSDQPAWEWSASHTERHLIPGIVAVVGGVFLWARTRPRVLAGAALSMIAGIWFVISPFVPRAWLDEGGGGGADASTAMEIITPLGYHYVPGLVVVAISAFVIGRLFAVPRGVEAARPGAEPEQRPAADADRRDVRPGREREREVARR